jgi:hypothetical protein
MVKWVAGALVALVLVVAAGWWGVGYYNQQRAERPLNDSFSTVESNWLECDLRPCSTS